MVPKINVAAKVAMTMTAFTLVAVAFSSSLTIGKMLMCPQRQNVNTGIVWKIFSELSQRNIGEEVLSGQDPLTVLANINAARYSIITKERNEENRRNEICEKKLRGKATNEKTDTIQASLLARPRGSKESPMMMSEVIKAPLHARTIPNSTASPSFLASARRQAVAKVSFSPACSCSKTCTPADPRNIIPR